MQFKLTFWFAVFAALIFVGTLLGRVFKWEWLFSKIDKDHYWEPSHVLRYTLVPFGIAVLGFYHHFAS